VKLYIAERVRKIADYIIDNRATVRAAAKVYGVSKSTVHKDMSERLTYIDKTREKLVKEVLEENLSERHIRGGNATKRKYKKS
jgi:putative DeoR family transcriptional regulator (stage III sporulation protein D)